MSDLAKLIEGVLDTHQVALGTVGWSCSCGIPSEHGGVRDYNRHVAVVLSERLGPLVEALERIAPGERVPSDETWGPTSFRRYQVQARAALDTLGGRA